MKPYLKIVYHTFIYGLDCRYDPNADEFLAGHSKYKYKQWRTQNINPNININNGAPSGFETCFDPSTVGALVAQAKHVSNPVKRINFPLRYDLFSRARGGAWLPAVTADWVRKKYFLKIFHALIRDVVLLGPPAPKVLGSDSVPLVTKGAWL